MNNPNRTVNDSQSGTNKPNAIWTAAPHKSEYEQSRYYRSASGYPSGPEHVSSSRKHEKQLSSSRDPRMRTEATDSQPYPPPSQTRHRDSAYPDPAHHRSTQTPLTSSKKYDLSVYRPAIPPEDTAQSQAPKYEQWIPPSQHSPSSQHKRERERKKEKERQRVKDEHRHERREPTDARERHKRKQEEGESDWDKDRERREKERHKERDYEKGRDQDRQRPREEHAENRREKSEKDNVERTEREQRKYMEMVQQRAEEKEAVREREREKRRQEREMERERERERERHRQRKDEERANERVSKTDVERDKEKERKRERREREHRREVESGRESERDPDRRRRKGDLEQGKERPKKLVEVPVASYDGTRREVELEEFKRMQDVVRRHKAGVIDSGPVSRDQEAERSRYATKDLSGARRKDYEKVQNLGDESEADRVRHSDKENVVRREPRIHEKAKRSGVSRPNAERGTDSEREHPSHRDVAFSNTYLREAVLPGVVAPETAVAPFSKPSAAHYLRDDKGPLVTQPRISLAHPSTGTSPATPIAPISEAIKQTPPNDGHATHSYPIPVSRPIDASSTTAKYSPVSVVSTNGESPRLDSTGSEVVRTKQASSSHRTLKRQSRIANLLPEQITILPTKHTQPQDILQPPVDAAPPPPSHVPRPRKDSGRLHPAEAPEHLSLQTKQALPPKADFRNASSMGPLPTSGRAPTRDSTIIPQSHVLHDKRSPDVLQALQKDLQVGVPTSEVFPLVGMPGMPVNNSLSSSFVSRANQDPRTAIKRPDISTPMPAQPLLAPSVEKVASSSSTKPSASLRGTNHPSVVNDVPLRRPYSALGEPSPQEKGERAKEKLALVPSTGLSSSPGAPQAYPVDRSVSSDTQRSNGISELQPVNPYRRVATGMFEPKQEGFQSRVHLLASIPENPTVAASHRPAFRLPTEQPAVTEKRAPFEPTSITRVEQGSRVPPLGPIPENTTVAASHRSTSRLQIEQSAVMDKRTPSEPTSATRVEQEGLQSRVHSLAPIPENATVAASHRSTSRLQIDPTLQPAVSDKRTSSEPTSATRVEQEDLQARVHLVASIPENATVAASHRPTSRFQIEQPGITNKRAPPEPTSAIRVEQEGLQSRVHLLVPIPENPTVAASHRPASHFQTEQPAVTEKRAPTEPTSASRVEQEGLQSRAHTLAPIPENATVTASHRYFQTEQPAVTEKRAPTEPTSASRVEQEGLQSRVHTLAPIPENATVTASHRLASRFQTEQPVVTEKRAPTEPTSATRVEQEGLQSRMHPLGPIPTVAASHRSTSRLQIESLSQPGIIDKRAPSEPTLAPRVEQEGLQSRMHPLAPIPENPIVAASHRPASRLHINLISQPAVTDKHEPTSATRVEQEGLQSRMHPLAPIPENATVVASRRPASRLQTDSLSQPAVTDKRALPEQTSATRVALRSISEPIGAPSRPQTDPPPQQPVATADKRVPPEPVSSARVTFRSVSESSGAHYIPVVKMKPIKPGRDESKRVATEPYHTSYSVNPETALRSLTGQHKHDDLVVYPIDPGREEAHVKDSPTASSRREVSAQPSINKRPNANDTFTTSRPGHARANSSNHGRTESSPGKTVEGPLPAISYSPSSRPTEEKHGHVAQASLERHVNELDPSASRDPGTTRDRDDMPQFTEREPVASLGVVLSSTTSVVAPQMVAHDGRPVIAHGLVAGNSYDLKNPDYHQSIQTAQHQVLDTVAREQDVFRKQRKERTKKPRSPDKDQVQLNYKEEHDHHRPPLDNKNTSHHEGLAYLGKKTGAGTSPMIAVPQSSFPRPDPQSTFSEIDSRHGTPRNVLQSSPGQYPANSIVKTPNQGVSKPESNQEYSPKASVSRPHESPSRYPHSVYRSSPSYPTMDYLKNQASPHIPSSHSQSHSPSFPSSRDARGTTPVVTQNEQPLPDSTESGNKTSSKYHRGQPKEQGSTSPRSARPDSSRMASKPFNPPTNPQLPETINYQTTSSHAVQPDMNRRIAETNPVQLPPSSLLFSKGIDQPSPYTPPEYKEYSYGSSPNDQDFEKHEPRLITPKSQKLPEIADLQQRSTYYDGAKVNALEPYQETHKKSSSLDTSRTKPLSEQTHPHEIWHPPGPSREYEPDRVYRRHVVPVAGSSIPAVIRAQPSTSIGIVLPLDEEIEQANQVKNVAPVHVYRYLQAKRNRTISVLSTEAQDGTATSTLGSPTASILSQPPIRVPSHRDPMKAAHEWLSENMEVAAKRGKTVGKRPIMRPGVVFDVGEDPPVVERVERRHRSKASRSKTQPTHT